MGQEVVYCQVCHEQLRTADFEKGAAFRHEGTLCCKACLPEALRTLAPEAARQLTAQVASAAKARAAGSSGAGAHGSSKPSAAAPNPPKTSRVPLADAGHHRTAEGTPSGSNAVVVGFVVATVAVALLVAGIMSGTSGRPVETSSSSKLSRTTPLGGSESPGPAPRVKTREELRSAEAQGKLEEIEAVKKGNRFAADEIRRRYAEFAKDYGDTAQGRAIETLLKESLPKPETPKGEIAPKPPDPEPVKAPDPTPPPAPPPPAPAPVPVPASPPPVRPAVPAARTRKPVPDASKLGAAEAAFHKSFRSEQARTPPEKSTLAREMLTAASGAGELDRWVLLREARDLAAQAADLKTATDAIDARAALFEIDATGEKLELFAKATMRGPPALAWARGALDLALEASETDDYETAVKLAGRAESLARSGGDKAVEGAAKEAGKEYAELRRLADGIRTCFRTLEAKPEDPAANLAVGKFLSLIKGDWSRGLPMLAKGTDPALKSLAAQELRNPGEAPMQAAIGEAWAIQADKETPTYKARARARAGEWLGRAIPSLSGPEKASAEKALAALGPLASSRDRTALDLGGGVRMELVYLRPGAFTMGGSQAPSSPNLEVDQRPEHRVTLSRGYFLGKYPVTRGQFGAFVKATGYRTEAERDGKATARSADGKWEDVPGMSWQNPNFPQTDDHPVTCISWNDAKAFCDWAARKTGRGVRLPSEADWEYACRAGTRTRWFFGDDEAAMVDYAWMDKNSGMQTHPVGQKKPNPWGLYDMVGNLWEWCQDWAGPYGADDVDPAGPAAGDRRIMRGGSWMNGAGDGCSAMRRAREPVMRRTYNGFRVEVR